MKWLHVLGLFVLFAALAALPMGHVLLQPDSVLAFNDGGVEFGLSPAYCYPDAVRRIWDNQFFFGAGSKQAAINIQSLNETVFGPHGARRAGVVVILAFCGCTIYWAWRQYRVSRAAAAVAAGAVMLSGVSFSFAVAGLYVRPTALAFSALGLGFAERGRLRNRWLDFLLAGGCVGLAVSEVPDVGAFLALTVAALVAVRHLTTQGWAWPSVGVLALRGCLIGAAALLLAWQTLTNVSATTIEGVTQGDSAAERYAWATQWSIPVAETWDIVAGSYFGASMSHPDVPYWGGIGRSEGWEQTHQGFRNFRMSAWYAGVVPSLLLLTLIPMALRRRSRTGEAEGPDRALAITVLAGCLVTLMLSWGKHFPLYRLLWSLPYFGTVRNPDKWNAPFMLCMGLGMALALDGVLARLLVPEPAANSRRQPPAGAGLRPLLIAAGSLAGIALLMALDMNAGREAFLARLGSQGFGHVAGALWAHGMWISFKVIAICVLFAVAVWWAGRRRRAGILVLAVAALTAVDLVDSGRFFASGHAYKALVAPNPLTRFLGEHAREGRIELLPPQARATPDDPDGGRAAAIAGALNQMRMTMFMASGFDLFNPVSVSRMPTDYESLFSSVGYISPRRFELGSIRWLVTVPGIGEVLNQMDGNRGRFVERIGFGLEVRDGGAIPVAGVPADQEIVRVVEFTGALPKFQPVSRVRVMSADKAGEQAALAILASPDFNPREEALVYAPVDGVNPVRPARVQVDIVREAPADVDVEVTADQPALLVRSVKYDADWTATINGQPVQILRANYLFQGIPVPAGTSHLSLQYAPSRRNVTVAAAGRAALLLLILASLWRRDATRAGATIDPA
ncbi:MAG: YfhO family protein [Lentisphaerae bacterium]|nr:YfhO family protein [Lentisphaerota bacterium]